METSLATTTRTLRTPPPAHGHATHTHTSPTSSIHGRATRKHTPSEATGVSTRTAHGHTNDGALTGLASHRHTATRHPGTDGQGPALRHILTGIRPQRGASNLTVCFSEEWCRGEPRPARVVLFRPHSRVHGRLFRPPHHRGREPTHSGKIPVRVAWLAARHCAHGHHELLRTGHG